MSAPSIKWIWARFLPEPLAKRKRKSHPKNTPNLLICGFRVTDAALLSLFPWVGFEGVPLRA